MKYETNIDYNLETKKPIEKLSAKPVPNLSILPCLT